LIIFFCRHSNNNRLDGSSIETDLAPSTRRKTTDPIARQNVVHALVAAAARKVRQAADEVGDAASGGLAVGRFQMHEKNAWMLRSHLE
jgi:DNA-binding ferritin-like protein